MTGPLTSLKILDFSTLLPGPFGSMILVDLGADVLRVEAPQRPDMVRFIPPYDGDSSAWHRVLNRNKKAIALDMKKKEAVEIVHKLISDGGYDILLEQFRPGVMARLGIGYEALRAVNPQLIYCAVTGYGQTGPYRDRAGHDNNYLALSGMLSHSGRKAEGPPPLGMQVADIGGGAMGAVIGILAAVVQRTQTGVGQMVDISMLDMSIAWQAHVVSHYLVGGETPERESWSLNGGGFYDYYETKDGRFLSVGSLEPKFWHRFCHAIGRLDLLADGGSLDMAVQQTLKVEIRQEIKRRNLDEWMIIFAQLDACVEPVLTIPEMIEHPQTKARGMIVDVPKADGTTQKQVGSPFKFSQATATYTQVGGGVGANSQDVLRELGFSEAEIVDLGESGVLG